MPDDIFFYKAINGKEYAHEFLEELKISNHELWINLTAVIKHIQKIENRKRPHSAPLGKGLFEVRAKSRNVQARMNFTFDKGIYLLNGYIKQDKGSMKRGVQLGNDLLSERNERKK